MVLFSELSPSDQENLSGGGFASAPPTEGPEAGWGDQEEGSCSGASSAADAGGSSVGILWILGQRQPRGGLRGIIPRLRGGVRGSNTAYCFSCNPGSLAV